MKIIHHKFCIVIADSRSKASLSPAKAPVAAVNATTTASSSAPAKKEKKKTKKQIREENAPAVKRPLSAYMLFNNNRRPILRGEYPSKFKNYFSGFFIKLCSFF